jgi:hypothetical protein
MDILSGSSSAFELFGKLLKRFASKFRIAGQNDDTSSIANPKWWYQQQKVWSPAKMMISAAQSMIASQNNDISIRKCLKESHQRRQSKYSGQVLSSSPSRSVEELHGRTNSTIIGSGIIVARVKPVYWSIGVLEEYEVSVIEFEVSPCKQRLEIDKVREMKENNTVRCVLGGKIRNIHSVGVSVGVSVVTEYHHVTMVIIGGNRQKTLLCLDPFERAHSSCPPAVRAAHF